MALIMNGKTVSFVSERYIDFWPDVGVFIAIRWLLGDIPVFQSKLSLKTFLLSCGTRLTLRTSWPIDK